MFHLNLLHPVRMHAMDENLVSPVFEREDDAAPGPFYVVKGLCLICDFPNQMAEGNFAWDESFKKGGCTGCPNHCRVERQPETPEELARVIEAAVGSCVEAIRYCGTDPEVLAKFMAEGKGRLCDALWEPRTVNEVVDHWFLRDRTLLEVCLNTPELAWEAILEILRRQLSGDDRAMLAAGPLETLFTNHGGLFIERVEQEALKNPQFKELLGGVWRNSIPEEVWTRVERLRQSSW